MKGSLTLETSAQLTHWGGNLTLFDAKVSQITYLLVFRVTAAPPPHLRINAQ